MTASDSGLRNLLQPTRGQQIVAEFLTSSAQIPIAIALATLLSKPPALWPLIVPLLAGAFIQAWTLVRRGDQGLAGAVALNLIGPALFTLGMAVADWQGLARDPVLPVYWCVYVLVGLCQGAAHGGGRSRSDVLLVAEFIIRAIGVVCVYAAVFSGLSAFLARPGHLFLLVALALLGLAHGMSAALHRRDRMHMGEVAGRLHGYGEMLLGRSMLHRAIGRDDDLRPRRTRRSVLFADVRGFTKWSETRSPEEVLLMLDGVYTAAEQACAPFRPERTKHTGDEVMMFFTEPVDAARAAIALRDEVGAFLSLYGLHVGIGVHHGDVIEGLFGSVRTKAYDILGDTVNTAKRVSDHAKAGRIVVTFTFFEACRGRIAIASDERINAKGKSSAILVAELASVSDADPTTDESALRKQGSHSPDL